MPHEDLYERFKQLVRGENARNMSRENLVSTFVETPQFEELLSPKNHIILGARGSGKTALTKMLSHDHLSALAERGSTKAKAIIESKEYVGIYLSTRSEWVGSLKNKPWSNPSEKEAHFNWRLNIVTCKVLLKTLQSCIERYIETQEERVRLEREVVEALSKDWLSDRREETHSFERLREVLEDYEWLRQKQYTRKRSLPVDSEPIGTTFEMGLFAPLQRGIQLARRHIQRGLEESTWFLCIDEAEFLDEDHHRVLNSHLRADTGNLFFKITTVPYGHKTTDTNIGDPVRNGHDFEYTYIARKRTPRHEEEFAETLFSQLVDALDEEKEDSNGDDDLTLQKLLGRSDLLESKNSAWKLDSKKMELLKRHSTSDFYNRAVRLKKAGEEEKFRSSVVRKTHGLLKLREAVKTSQGAEKLDVYSGWKMLARCGEENPRRILRLLQKMISIYGESTDSGGTPLVSKVRQNEVFVRHAKRELWRTKTEPNCRERLHELLFQLGDYANRYFLERDFTGDVVSAYEIKNQDPSEFRDLTERAVQWGLLYPKVNKSNPDDLPIGEGTFHLANVLAPLFRLLPRRGRSHRLTTIWKGLPSYTGGSQRELGI